MKLTSARDSLTAVDAFVLANLRQPFDRRRSGALSYEPITRARHALYSQRGFADLIMLLVYAGIAAAVLGAAYAAWHGFKDSIGKPYAEAQRLADQKVVDKAGEAQKQAESDRDTARGNKDRCETALGVANKGKEEAEKRAKERADESRKVRAESDRKDAAARPYIAGLEVRAAAAPKLQKCEDEMAAARPVLQEALRRGRIAPPVGPK